MSDNEALLGSGADIPQQWRETNTTDKFMNIPIVMRPNLAGFVPARRALRRAASEYAVGVAAKEWWKDKLQSISCVESSNQFLIKGGSLLLSSTYLLTSLSVNPNTTLRARLCRHTGTKRSRR